MKIANDKLQIVNSELSEILDYSRQKTLEVTLPIRKGTYDGLNKLFPKGRYKIKMWPLARGLYKRPVEMIVLLNCVYESKGMVYALIKKPYSRQPGITIALNRITSIQKLNTAKVSKKTRR